MYFVVFIAEIIVMLNEKFMMTVLI